MRVTAKPAKPAFPCHSAGENEACADYAGISLSIIGMPKHRA